MCFWYASMIVEILKVKFRYSRWPGPPQGAGMFQIIELISKTRWETDLESIREEYTKAQMANPDPILQSVRQLWEMEQRANEFKQRLWESEEHEQQLEDTVKEGKECEQQLQEEEENECEQEVIALLSPIPVRGQQSGSRLST